jgi:hypothetical protein
MWPEVVLRAWHERGLDKVIVIQPGCCHGRPCKAAHILPEGNIRPPANFCAVTTCREAVVIASFDRLDIFVQSSSVGMPYIGTFFEECCQSNNRYSELDNSEGHCPKSKAAPGNIAHIDGSPKSNENVLKKPAMAEVHVSIDDLSDSASAFGCDRRRASNERPTERPRAAIMASKIGHRKVYP